MGGIDWAVLPVIAEMLDIEDYESLIYQLIAIRDHQKRQSEAWQTKAT